MFVLTSDRRGFIQDGLFGAVADKIHTLEPDKLSSMLFFLIHIAYFDVMW